MFDDPFVFFALVIAIVALIFARKAMNQVAELRQRLEAIQAAPAAATAPVPPPLTPFEAFEQTLPPASTAAAPTPPPIVPDVESITPDAPSETSKQAAGGAAAPPPLPQPDRGFEETIGTRWVVWIGGLTLALGGFFMVRYSIEAGLLGPGVRTILGGLFALALLWLLEYNESEKVFRSMELTVKTRNTDRTQEMMKKIFQRHNLEAEVRSIAMKTLDEIRHEALTLTTEEQLDLTIDRILRLPG